MKSNNRQLLNFSFQFSMKRFFLFIILFSFCSNYIFAQVFPKLSGDEPFYENQGTKKALDTLIYDGIKKAQIDTFQFSFTPPKEYMKVNHQTFVNFRTSSFIQVSEMKRVVYLMAVRNITPEVLEPQGVKYIGQETVMTIDNHEGILVFVTNQIDGKDYERMMLFTGDYIRTLWISATYPLELKAEVYETLKKSLLSIKF